MFTLFIDTDENEKTASQSSALGREEAIRKGDRVKERVKVPVSMRREQVLTNTDIVCFKASSFHILFMY